MRCPACACENPDGNRFCEDCGGSLSAVCSACGAQLGVGKRFCGACGAPVGAASAARASTQPAPTAAAAAATTELRHVSVLFCDLVGFTPFSEKRDPEEVRELLSGYFELARAIVSRYGGIVEKFIGDAVMAVWGALVANEDDSERAVRAGLELVSAVSAYGFEHATELQARVGIVTGGAATTTAEEGLVIGDRVNTAARIQSAAAPGTCYVDETTRAASAAAIAYVDAGEHELKGKAEPVRLFQATRVVAAIAGSQRSGVIEAPFIGRDHELHLVKELFHSSAERGSARMVLVSGVAGVGKSRLAWEFFKYADGLAGDLLWHSGRCLSYGEGVSYWALSEMVRARLQISEEDPADLVAERLRTGLERWIPDPADRAFISPRLGQLLGLPAAQVLAKEELFSGWRLFFERLSEFLPVLMVVEDLQWADAGLVDFLDHILEWSGDHAIFLLVLTRPEGTDRRGLVLSRRSVTTLSLDPLSDEVMGDLLDGLVSGLPAPARARIVERAEGIPLYAIETVRGLLDKRVLDRGDDGLLHLVGDLGELEIPPGLTALIASRLDALSADERRLVKECSVLGGSFPRQAVGALSEIEPGLLDELLTSLVRKEVLTVRADRLSPERGQYAFTQSLIRSVAYDMLTRAERKARHMRTAEHLRAAFPDEGAEVAEVIGAHLYDAYKAAGEDPDAGQLRAAACAAYTRAADRAEAVGAPDAAESAYLKAAELSSDEVEGADFVERAGLMAQFAGWNERALEHFETTVAAHARAGRILDAARTTSRISVSLQALGRGEQAISRIQEALASLEGNEAPPEILADLQARLGGALNFSGHAEASAEPLERALVLAQHYELEEPLGSALAMKGSLLMQAGRIVEARALMEAAIAVARRHGLTRAEMTAEIGLADLCMTRDLVGAEEHCEHALELARHWGARHNEAFATGNLMYIMILHGRFDEAYRLGADLLHIVEDNVASAALLHEGLAHIDALKGRAEDARGHLAGCRAWATSDDVQFRVAYAALEAAVALAGADHQTAVSAARRAIGEAVDAGLPIALDGARTALAVGVEAAIAASDLEAGDALVAPIATRPVGEVPPFERAHLRRYEALRSAATGQHENVERGLIATQASFRDLGYTYWTARAQLDLAEWLGRQARHAESARHAHEAAAAFELLGAAPMLARARALVEPEGGSDPGEGDSPLAAQRGLSRSE
jgi:class 3 adenylate cyclase/tetratricopeptide (TPR) repeat protein